MREKRNGLRPIKADVYGETLVGYFHGFVQEGSNEDGIGAFATIELENGEVHQVDAYKVKFEDVE